jgi:hypothetical protein
MSVGKSVKKVFVTTGEGGDSHNYMKILREAEKAFPGSICSVGQGVSELDRRKYDTIIPYSLVRERVKNMALSTS